MWGRVRQLTLAFVALLLLLALEVWISFLPFTRALRSLALAPAGAMCWLIAVSFMELERGRELVRLFGVAALLWLAILLGLGALDPLTRVSHDVTALRENAK